MGVHELQALTDTTRDGKGGDLPPPFLVCTKINTVIQRNGLNSPHDY